MGRKKVGSPVSVALTPDQTAWVKDQGLTVSEAIRRALDSHRAAGPTGYLETLIRQVEAEVLRLRRLGIPDEPLTKALENLWRLVIET